MQQHHQHHVYRAPFEADPHSQTENNKEERLSFKISRCKFTASEVTDNTALSCSARQTSVRSGQGDIYAWSQLLEEYSLKFFAFAEITGCGSASLKLCICYAASTWSQNPSPDLQ